MVAKQVFLVCGARKTSTNVYKYRAEMVCEKMINKSKVKVLNYRQRCLMLEPREGSMKVTIQKHI